MSEPGNEVGDWTKVTSEKRQELLDKLAIYEVAEVTRRSPQVAIAPNLMVESRGRPMEASGNLGRGVPSHTFPSIPFACGPSASTTASSRPCQSTLEENWNPRLKEETDMVVAHFFFHDHIAFYAAL